MTYQPLHHKYRPQTFADLVGQEAIATTLSNAIRSSKIAPAYLFTGPRGTGKTSSARILAKSLNCRSGDIPTERPCGVCEVCRAIASGSALDVIEIDAASNTGVDNIRELIERAQFAPVQCRYKVYIIDECHMLSVAAFNALLKTLEEPPKHVVFILATTDPQRVLATIISRCQRFDFRRIAIDAMVQHLRVIATKENINIKDDALALVAQVAQGGLRDAESLLDQLSLLPGEVTVEKVWDLVGSVPEQDLMELLKALVSDNPEAVISRVRHLMDRGREPLIILQNLAGFYRDLLIAKTAPTRSELVALTSTTWKALCEEALHWDTDTILAGSKYLKDSEFQIKNTTQPGLWLEVTIFGLLPSALAISSTEKPKSPPQNSSRLTSVGKETQPHAPGASPKPEVQPPATPPAPTPKPTTEVSQTQTPKEQPREQPEPSPQVSQPAEVPAKHSDYHQIWQQVLAYVEPNSRRALLGQLGHLIAFDGQEARIGIPQIWCEDIQEGRPMIEEAFQKALNLQVKVKIEAIYPTENHNTPKNKQRYRSPEPKAQPSKDSESKPSPEVKQENPAQNPLTKPPEQIPSQVTPQTKIETPKFNPTVEPPPPTVPPTQKLQPPPPKIPDSEVEAVASAAQKLIKTFSGKIIRMPDELPQPQPRSIQPPKPEMFNQVTELEIDSPEREDDEDMEF